MNSAEHRPSAWVDDGHDDLRAAWAVEHNPVDRRTAASDAYEFSWASRLHRCERTVPMGL
jgi:hypothetical protein